MPGQLSSAPREPLRGTVEPPRLLVELPSRRQVFLSNLSDLLHGRVVPPQRPGLARDYKFWKSLPPQQHISRAALLQSFLFHVIFLDLIYLFSVVPWFAPQPVVLRDPLSHTHISFYSVSDYLPPTVPEGARAAPNRGTPEPVYARQKILSLTE